MQMQGDTLGGSFKQDTILKIGDFSFQPKTKISPQNPCFKYFHVRTHPR
jgi:hypothetical protein